MNTATAEVIVQTLMKNIYEHRKELIKQIKTECMEISGLYQGNIKIEIDINTKIGNPKIRITEFDV